MCTESWLHLDFVSDIFTKMIRFLTKQTVSKLYVIQATERSAHKCSRTFFKKFQASSFSSSSSSVYLTFTRHQHSNASKYKLSYPSFILWVNWIWLSSNDIIKQSLPKYIHYSLFYIHSLFLVLMSNVWFCLSIFRFWMEISH